MNQELISEIERFLYREARMLDDRRFHEWLDLLTDDVRYWMPIRSNRYPANSKAISVMDGSRYEERDLSGEGELAIMEEDKDSLTRRVERLDSGMAWAEDPPSRTRPLCCQRGGGTGTHRIGAKSLLQHHHVPDPRRNRTRLLCGPAGGHSSGAWKANGRWLIVRWCWTKPCSWPRTSAIFSKKVFKSDLG